LASTAVVSNTTATTGMQSETPSPVLVPIVKKLPLCYCWATDGGRKKFHAHIIDESFLQRLLEYRSGGESSPTTIAIKWTIIRSKANIPITSIMRFTDDDDDDTNTINETDGTTR